MAAKSVRARCESRIRLFSSYGLRQWLIHYTSATCRIVYWLWQSPVRTFTSGLFNDADSVTQTYRDERWDDNNGIIINDGLIINNELER